MPLFILFYFICSPNPYSPFNHFPGIYCNVFLGGRQTRSIPESDWGLSLPVGGVRGHTGSTLSFSEGLTSTIWSRLIHTHHHWGMKPLRTPILFEPCLISGLFSLCPCVRWRHVTNVTWLKQGETTKKNNCLYLTHEYMLSYQLHKTKKGSKDVAL